MKGTVTKLFDIDRIVIPQELLDLHVEENEIEEKIQLLSIRYAKENDVEVVTKGDTVYCKVDENSYPDGRKVILYTGTNIPAASNASEKAIGKNVNDTFTATLADKNVTLTIQQIIHRTPVEVDDALIARLGIEDVQTIEAYRNYLKEQILADMRMERHKTIFYHYITELVNNSEYAYEKDEMDEYVQSLIAQYPPESLAEMNQEAIEANVLNQVKESLIADAFCSIHNIEIDMKEVEEAADQMLEMQALMGEEVPAREDMIEMYLQNMKFNAVYEYVDKIATEKLGG